MYLPKQKTLSKYSGLQNLPEKYSTPFGLHVYSPGRQLPSLKKSTKEEPSALLGRTPEHLVTAFAMVKDWE